MKNIIVIIFSFVLIFNSLAQDAATTFYNPSKNMSFDILSKWEAAGNMKGIELFLTKIENTSSPSILTCSKEKNVESKYTLDTYFASKINLQLSVLKGETITSNDLKIGDFDAKSIEYSYLNNELEDITSKIVILFYRGDAYQFTASCLSKNYNDNFVIFNHFFDNFKFIN
jgi:uncharacterized protein YihD (DUF1040 family)